MPMDDPRGPEVSTRRGLAQGGHSGCRAPRERPRRRPRAGGLDRRSISTTRPMIRLRPRAYRFAPAWLSRRAARTPVREASLDEWLALAHTERLTRRDAKLRGLATEPPAR
jgi:hypothetical protein